MKDKVIQICVSFILSVLPGMSAYSIVWPSYTLRVLESKDSPLGFSITKFEGNLIASIPMLSSVISTLYISTVSDKIGRKKTQVLCALFIIVSWSLIVTARSMPQILIGRFITGLHIGMSIANVLVFVSEITNISVRGTAMAGCTLLYNIGVLVSYIEGWFCSYEVIGYMNITGMSLYVIIICMFKESPVWLLNCGREKEALESLKFYRGVSKDTDAVLQELTEMKKQFGHYKLVQDTDLEKSKIDTEKEKSNMDENNLNQNKTSNPWRLLFTVPHNRRALITTVLTMVFGVCMGMVAVQAFAGRFFETAAPNLSSDMCSVFLAIVMVVGCVVTVVVTDFIGRRMLIISMSIASTACLAVIGSALRWSWAPSWVPPLMILLYCIFYHLGPINVPFVLLGEVFGPEVKSSASSLVLSFMFISNFLVLYLYGPAVQYLGIDWTFLIFAAIGAVSVIICHFVVKESRHKSLEEVQKMYSESYF